MWPTSFLVGDFLLFLNFLDIKGCGFFLLIFKKDTVGGVFCLFGCFCLSLTSLGVHSRMVFRLYNPFCYSKQKSKPKYKFFFFFKNQNHKFAEPSKQVEAWQNTAWKPPIEKEELSLPATCFHISSPSTLVLWNLG